MKNSEKHLRYANQAHGDVLEEASEIAPGEGGLDRGAIRFGEGEPFLGEVAGKFFEGKVAGVVGHGHGDVVEENAGAGSLRNRPSSNPRGEPRCGSFPMQARVSGSWLSRMRA